MKGNIKDEVGSLDSISDGTRVDNYDVNIKIFLVGTSDDVTLGKFDSNMLGVADSSKLGV